MVRTANRRQNGGAALVEFTLVAMLLLPLCLLTLQLALLTATRRVLDVAVVMAARAGTVAHGSEAAIRAALGDALLPLHVTDENDLADDFRAAAAAARAEAGRADRVALRILSPAAVDVLRFPPPAAGPPEVPNEGFDRRANADHSRAAELLAANTLSVELRYCAALVVPVAAPILSGMLRTENDAGFERQCFEQQRIPIRVRATQVMQSAFRAN